MPPQHFAQWAGHWLKDDNVALHCPLLGIIAINIIDTGCSINALYILCSIIASMYDKINHINDIIVQMHYLQFANASLICMHHYLIVLCMYNKNH